MVDLNKYTLQIQIYYITLLCWNITSQPWFHNHGKRGEVVRMSYGLHINIDKDYFLHELAASLQWQLAKEDSVF